MKTLTLARAILIGPIFIGSIFIGLSASAHAEDLFLLCRTDGAFAGFNIGVDLANSALTVYEPTRTRRYPATITPDAIEYTAGMFATTIDRRSGDWVAWSYTGTMAGRGSCQQTNDQRRLEENVISVKPRE
jgi:hypothetical protein